MVTQSIKSDTTYFIKESDRHIRVVREGTHVVGLAFCQGDDYETFVSEYYDIDYSLVDFFNSIALNIKGNTEIERIDTAIWCYHYYTLARDERKHTK
mgnify:CR=1 FL=1